MVVVFVSLALVALLMAAGIAVDGGQAYAQRRTMQNAADSAAMAGTRAIDKVRFPTGTPPAPATIYSAIQTEMNAQGATSFKCWLIDSAGTRVPPGSDACASSSAMTLAWAAVPGGVLVAGVEVEATSTRDTYFARVGGFQDVTSRATASATVQPFLGGGGSPFIVCGVKSANADSYDILTAAGTLSASALAGAITNVPLQGSQQHSCGAGSAFKGKNNSNTILVGVPCPAGQSPPFTIPCEKAWGDNGNGYSANIYRIVSSAVPCAADLSNTPCDILVPVADYGNGNGNDIEMRIIGWVVMRVSGDGTGNPKYFGTVLGQGGLVGEGQGGTGDVHAGQVRVIKLIE